MSINKFLRKLQKSFRQLWGLSVKLPKRFINRILASLVGQGRSRRHQRTAGFVLPTVAMVMLVVVLLTTAMVLRSFDRAKNASNFRVNQAVLNVSTPAVERAKAKIEALFSDPILPRSTPTETLLYNTIVTQPEKYIFGDEIALKVVDDFGDGKGGYSEEGDGTFNSLDNDTADKLEYSETINTAWKFPVDTDNNGKFDSFTLYGIYFRTPPRGDEARPRRGIEARTVPMEEVSQPPECAGGEGTSSGLVGSTGWYKVGSQLRKSFYIYTATVPITVDPTTIPSLTGGPDSIFEPAKYEEYQGNSSFAALEVQQDQGQIPLQYQSVWYEDDLTISPGPGLNLNGRVFSNSNLFVEKRSGDVDLYLISSPASCYFEEENSKILVGGELVNGDPRRTSASKEPIVHLYNENMKVGDTPASEKIDHGKTESVSDNATEVAYNNEAYVERIDFLVRSAIAGAPGVYELDSSSKVTSMPQDPPEVQSNVEAKLEADGGDSLDVSKVRRDQLELYFRNRTRRVPMKEVATGESALEVGSTDYKEIDTDEDGVADADASVFPGTPFPSSEDSAVDLRPPGEWMYPADPTDGKTTGSYTTLKLTLSKPGMTKPEVREAEDPLKENYLGDRILLGNNLPALWYKDDGSGEGSFVGEEEPQEIKDIKWTYPSSEGPRTRWSRVQRLDDLGTTDRDGFWEQSAAEEPESDLENKGGLRVVTGAGIYVTGGEFDNDESFLPRPVLGAGIEEPAKLYGTEENIVVWPDTMPMWEDTGGPSKDDPPNGLPDQYYNPEDPGKGDKRGDLLMRATVVYHYAAEADGDDFKDELPIACVSSYYDPTTRDTAKNRTESKDEDWDKALIDPLSSSTELRYDGTVGRSNNGIVYPTTDIPEDRSTISVTLKGQLEQQASLVFPNGRVVNQPLRTALEKIKDSEELSLADNSAIDAAICAINIENGKISPDTSPPIPHGAIYEQTFLDAQQIKAVHRDDADVAATDSTYTADITAFDETFSINTGFKDYPGDSPAYDLPVEERQPLEIRATVLDLDKLRTTTISSAVSTGPSSEYLLPNTGIIYATRNDALPDMSASGTEYATRLALSAVDFKLDPTRRPNAIMLVDGDRLDRGSSNEYYEAEKGLILATNLPVYIQASEGVDPDNSGFNLHQAASGGAILEEFKTHVDDDWGNFYERSDLDPDFACRKDQTGCEKIAKGGDLWRSATIVSDAVTLLSKDYRFGYRDEGDYDLRSNAGGARVQNIYYDDVIDDLPPWWDDPLLLWWDDTPNDDPEVPPTSSPKYIDRNPIADFDGCDLDTDGEKDFDKDADEDEYEKCEEYPNADDTTLDPKEIDEGLIYRRDDPNRIRIQNGFFANSYVTSREFTDDDYSDDGGTDSSYFNNFVTPVQRRTYFYEYVMEICRKPMVELCTPDDWVVGYDFNNDGDWDDDVDETTENLDLNMDGDKDDEEVPETDIPASALQRTVAERDRLGAGTTAKAAMVEADQRYPRRVAFLRMPDNSETRGVAFLRMPDNSLILTDGDPDTEGDERPIPIGIDGSGTVEWYPSEEVELPVTENQLDFGPDGVPMDPEVCWGADGIPNDPESISTKDDSLGADGKSDIIKDDGAGADGIKGTADDDLGPDGIPDGSKDDGAGADGIKGTADDDLGPDGIRGTEDDGAGTDGIKGTIDDDLGPDGIPYSKDDGAGLDGIKGTIDDDLGPDGTVDSYDDGWGLDGIAGTADDEKGKDGIAGTVDDGWGADGIPYIGDDGFGKDGIPGTEDDQLGADGILGTLDDGCNDDDGALETIQSIEDESPRIVENALWYTTNNSGARNYGNKYPQLWYAQEDPKFADFSGSGGVVGYVISDAYEQPLLEPILQLQSTTKDLKSSGGENQSKFKNIIKKKPVKNTRWIQPTTESTFNIVAVAGQGPIRIDTDNDRTEFGGGLQNYLRTLESWSGENLRVNGSFIQSKQNNYATGPQQVLMNNKNDLTGSTEAVFTDQLQGYYTDNGSGSLEDKKLGTNPYYTPPNRRFSFDVALMTQAADLFAEQFTVEPASSPKEFLREVGRDDEWIEVLLCAGEASDQVGGSGATYNNFAVPDKKQRPSGSKGCSDKDTTGYPANPG